MIDPRKLMMIERERKRGLGGRLVVREVGAKIDTHLQRTYYTQCPIPI